MTSGEFRTATNFDFDGPGPGQPELVVGGNFEQIHGNASGPRSLARWNGARWTTFLFTSPQTVTVRALTSFDLDGPQPNPPRLIVAGSFTLGFGGGASNNIVATDGFGSIRLSDGLDGAVNALATWDADQAGSPSLFAAGGFTRSGSRAVGPIARWDGTQWQRVGADVSGTINALAVLDLDADGPNPPVLVAAGRFNVNGQSAGVASYNGTTWTRIGGFLDSDVTDVDLFDLDGPGPNPPRVVITGSFRNTSLNGQAYFNGTSWQPITTIPSFRAVTGRAIRAFDADGPGPIPPRLYLAGNIPSNNGQPWRIVALEAGAWTPITEGTFNGDIYSLTPVTLPGSDAPILLAEGSLSGPAPSSFSFRLAIIDAGPFRPFGDGFSAAVYRMEPTTITGVPGVVTSGGAPYIPGSRGGISHFDGTAWTTLGMVGQGNIVNAMISYDPDADGPLRERVVVAGYLQSVNDVPVQNVAMYDGTSWAPMGAVTDLFTDLEVFDTDGSGPLGPSLLGAQGIIPGGPGTPGHLYRWNGTQWVTFGPDFVSNSGPPQVSYLAVFDPDAEGPAPRQLLVVGSFSRIGGLMANNVAVFDGGTWRAIGSGFSSNPQAAFAWDPQHNGREVVVVAGSFASASGVPARAVAVWNGTAWSALGAGFGQTKTGLIPYPSDFSVFGGDLYAAGGFFESFGAPGNGIARWDGTQWRPLGPGLDTGANCLTTLPASDTHPEMLLVGGPFQSAGGHASAFFAAYASLPCCPADTNADGVVDTTDFFLFLDRFMSVDPRADFNADGVIDSRDFFDYLLAYFHTC
jgi:hypothetical protein